VRGEIQFGWDNRDFKDKREEIIGRTKIIASEGCQGVIEKRDNKPGIIL